MAFLLSFLEYALNYQEDLLEEIDLEKLKELFKEWQNRICEWNLRSLEIMVETIPEETDYLRLKFESIQSDYVRLIIYTVAQYMSENKDKYQKKVLIPFDVLKPSFDNLPKDLKRGRYTSFYRLKEKIPKDISRLNSFLSPFGIEIQFAKVGGVEGYYLVIHNDKLLEFRNAFLYDIGVNGVSGVSDSENTLNTPNTPQVYKTIISKESEVSVINALSEATNKLKELVKQMGKDIPKPEIESRFPKEIIEKWLKEGLIADWGDFYSIYLDLED